MECSGFGEKAGFIAKIKSDGIYIKECSKVSPLEAEDLEGLRISDS